MFPAVLVCMACLAADPATAASIGSQSKTTDLTLYKEARAKIGHGADAHVRMALWCESHGLDSERLKHLAIAVLTDPAHATARGLLGLVAFRGQWQSPEAITRQARGRPNRERRSGRIQPPAAPAWATPPTLTGRSPCGAISTGSSPRPPPT